MSPVTYKPEGSPVSHKSPRRRLIGPGHYHPSEETSSPRRDPPGGSPPPNRSSPRRRPPDGSSQQGPSMPISTPVRSGQVILTPIRQF